MRLKESDLIVTISDLHIPYEHPSSLDFLKAIKAKYWHKASNPVVVFLGDELTWSAISYHEKDPTLYNSHEELELSLRKIKSWYRLFPKAYILESNHGSLVYRKQKTHGLPPGVFKSYNDILEIPATDWKWVARLEIGDIVFLHGKSKDVLKAAKVMGKSLVQGHYHESLSIQYYDAGHGLKFASQVGCLIDDLSPEFSYNKLNLLSPTIGTLVIKDGNPILHPMRLNKKGLWTGEL